MGKFRPEQTRHRLLVGPGILILQQDRVTKFGHAGCPESFQLLMCVCFVFEIDLVKRDVGRGLIPVAVCNIEFKQFVLSRFGEAGGVLHQELHLLRQSPADDGVVFVQARFSRLVCE